MKVNMCLFDSMLTPNVVRTLVPAVNASLQRTGLTVYPIEESKSSNPLGQPIRLINYSNCERTTNLYLNTVRLKNDNRCTLLRRGVNVIDSYNFGQIVIDGQRYTNDVIVFPDRVKADWWRKKGHRLHVEDIKEALEEKSNVLVVGTGYSGLMKVSPETEKYVKSRGVELIVQRTEEAYKTFNRLVKSGKIVIAAFHLTC